MSAPIFDRAKVHAFIDRWIDQVERHEPDFRIGEGAEVTIRVVRETNGFAFSASSKTAKLFFEGDFW